MIDLIDVSKSYGPGLPAVNHANLHVDKGEFVFIVGNSGSGKSTLIKLLLKELDSTSGYDYRKRRELEGRKPPPMWPNTAVSLVLYSRTSVF